jgi:hypothetical protein
MATRDDKYLRFEQTHNKASKTAILYRSISFENERITLTLSYSGA